MCYISFIFFVELLPLVEFQLEDGISDSEAIRLIESPFNKDNKTDSEWVQDESDTTQTLQIHENSSEENIEDNFTAHLMKLEVIININQYIF